MGFFQHHLRLGYKEYQLYGRRPSSRTGHGFVEGNTGHSCSNSVTSATSATLEVVERAATSLQPCHPKHGALSLPRMGDRALLEPGIPISSSGLRPRRMQPLPLHQALRDVHREPGLGLLHPPQPSEGQPEDPPTAQPRAWGCRNALQGAMVHPETLELVNTGTAAERLDVGTSSAPLRRSKKVKNHFSCSQQPPKAHFFWPQQSAGQIHLFHQSSSLRRLFSAALLSSLLLISVSLSPAPQGCLCQALSCLAQTWYHRLSSSFTSHKLPPCLPA